MVVRISGRGIDLGNSLREYATKEVDNLLEKYLGDDVETSVVVGKDNRLFEVEICAYLNKGFVVKTNGASDDAYRAVSIALERLEERIKKHKNRIKDKSI